MSSPTFAAATSVSPEKSRTEIDSLLAKHGTTSRGIHVNDESREATIVFAIVTAGSTNHYRLTLPLPHRNKYRDQRSYDQAVRTRWRAMVLVLKSKLEIIRIGMSTAQREFLSDLVLANGKTVAETLSERGAERLLPAYTGE